MYLKKLSQRVLGITLLWQGSLDFLGSGLLRRSLLDALVKAPVFIDFVYVLFPLDVVDKCPHLLLFTGAGMAPEDGLDIVVIVLLAHVWVKFSIVLKELFIIVHILKQVNDASITVTNL